MTDLRAAAELALEALKKSHPYSNSDGDLDRHSKAIHTLHTALAEQPAEQEPVVLHQFHKRGCADWYDGLPDHEDGGGPYETRTLYTAPPPNAEQQEPAAVVHEEDDGGQPYLKRLKHPLPPVGTKLYTAPQPAKQPLTDEQLIDLFNEACREKFNGLERYRYFARAIERAHGITGETK